MIIPQKREIEELSDSELPALKRTPTKPMEHHNTAVEHPDSGDDKELVLSHQPVWEEFNPIDQAKEGEENVTLKAYVEDEEESSESETATTASQGTIRTCLYCTNEYEDKSGDFVCRTCGWDGSHDSTETSEQLQSELEEEAPGSDHEPIHSNPNKKGNNVNWHENLTSSIEAPIFPSNNEADDFREAIRQIPDLGCLEETTIEGGISVLIPQILQAIQNDFLTARRRRALTLDFPPTPIMGRVKSSEADDFANDTIPLLESPSSPPQDFLPKTALQVKTYKTLLKVVDQYMPMIYTCTHCQILHYWSRSDPDIPIDDPCPSKLALSNPTWKVQSLFLKPLYFAKAQLAMKKWRAGHWNTYLYPVFTKKLDAVAGEYERTIGIGGVYSHWWGYRGWGTRFSVDAKKEGRERWMYRTQHFWVLREVERDRMSAKWEVERSMKRAVGVRMLCGHVEKEFWGFDDPGKWGGVRRCGECALEWEVSVGDVFEKKESCPGELVLDFSSGKGREVPVAEREKKKRNGMLIVLTCWRDMGMCKSTDDPRWRAHFPDYDEWEFEKEEGTEEEAWKDEDVEEPAQDWELGGIKRAFEGIDEYAGEEEHGDLKFQLEESSGKRLKHMLGKGEGNKSVFTVKFCDLTKIPPKPQTSIARTFEIVGSLFGGFKPVVEM